VLSDSIRACPDDRMARSSDPLSIQKISSSVQFRIISDGASTFASANGQMLLTIGSSDTVVPCPELDTFGYI